MKISRKSLIAPLFALFVSGAYFAAKHVTLFDGVQPANDADKRVARYVLDSFAGHLSFLCWGPHLYGDEMEGFPAWQDAEAVVRVKFSGSGDGVTWQYDLVFIVKGEEVEYVGNNPHGDNWIEKARNGKPPNFSPPIVLPR